jgi:hypothetical protein
MTTIKKPVKKYAMGGMTTTSETTKKPKGDAILFSTKDSKKRRKSLGLPTSKAEEKAYYEKMRKEGAKNGKTIKKAKSGTSLGMKSVKSGYDNNSGVTRADFVAIGKGTAKSGAKMKMGGKMAKKGTSVKKAGFGDILGKAAGSGMFGLAGLAAKKKMGYGGKAASMVPPMKKGGSVKKAQDGNNVVPRNLNKRQYERVNRINETSRERANKVANRISNRRNARGAENPRMNGDVQFNMKSGGSMKKAMMGTMAAPMMKKGGTMKKCKYGCK